MMTVGFDFGSVYTKAVLLGADGILLLSVYRRKESGDLQTVAEFFDVIERRCPGERMRAGVTGADPGSAGRGTFLAVSNIIAVAAGVQHTGLRMRTIVEIGGHTSKFIVCEANEAGGRIREFATNDACAAGTGAFLEQQARRLDLTVENLSALSRTAARAATVAGRCAVFAKSDMIHLQQKGIPVDEIAFGLCVAICRNALATLLKGREAETPVVIAGGCAHNHGILRAFTEALDCGNHARLQPSLHPGLEAAIGVAVGARDADTEALTAEEWRGILSTVIAAGAMGTTAILPMLIQPASTSRRAEPDAVWPRPVAGFLGVDVGSVSTDFAVLDAAGEVLAAVYLPTRGRPAEVVREGLAILKTRFAGGMRVLGCATTGSGRHLAGKLLGADVIKNEITCQLLGARRYVSDVDTVLEIGGQDSKFIAVRDGGIADFVMNKICAAGTGSFLEEQAREIGVDICGEFAARAIAAPAPRDLGTRCTVFMETEVVNALHGGVPAEDICSGLAYSIVRNYLDKVVGHRPLGTRIVFQGGVASNDAVVAAFAQVLGRPVLVHPFNRISGAIGAAIAAQEYMTGGGASRFRGLDPGPPPTLRTFECRHCTNHCEVSMIEAADERIYFGDTCERYTSRGTTASAAGLLPNLAEEYLAHGESCFPRTGTAGPVIGIPLASTFLGYLPFWGAFFRALGCAPVLSERSSTETLALGLKHLPVGLCLPVKLAAGHVNALLGEGVDHVFAPAVMHLPGEVPERSYSCPYTMAAPYMITTADAGRLLTPILSLTDEIAFADGFEPCGATLRVSRSGVRAAFCAAMQAQAEADAAFRARGTQLFKSGGYRHVFAVLGKPYNTYDSYLNLSLFERLRRLGVLALPLQYLPLTLEGLDSNLPWCLSADIHRAAQTVAAGDDMHPVIITNFGCGPDAFTFKQMELVLRRKAHLILEFDEHRGEAGLITRLEAFLDQIEGTARHRRQPKSETAGVATPLSSIPPPPAEIRIPYFADHVFAFSGLWKAKGYSAEVLPVPDASIRLLGEQYSQGRECHPYALILGDLLNLHRTRAGQDLVYYVPSTSIPCLLQQYGSGLQALLQELGIRNIRLCSPNGREMQAAFGIEAIKGFYLGLLAIDLLVKAACEIRPYETERGRTAEIHRQNLRLIEAAIVGDEVLVALDAGLRALAVVPMARTRRRPVVGVAGDIYTKANAAANSDLYQWLEDQGLEVWPSPFQVDLLDFDIISRLRHSVAHLELPELLVSSTLALRRAYHVWRVRNVVGRRLEHLHEPGYLELKALAGPYMPNEEHRLLYINVAKIVDFARHGADGVINAISLNCMVGNASAAIIEKIRRDYDDIPIITAVYAGGEDPARRLGLEAFVSQVKAHRRRSTTGPA
jgi:predicted CoA-substrate-specific enzyme activase